MNPAYQFQRVASEYLHDLPFIPAPTIPAANTYHRLVPMEHSAHLPMGKKYVVSLIVANQEAESIRMGRYSPRKQFQFVRNGIDVPSINDYLTIAHHRSQPESESVSISRVFNTEFFGKPLERKRLTDLLHTAKYGFPAGNGMLVPSFLAPGVRIFHWLTSFSLDVLCN